MIIALPYENGEVFQHFGKTENFAFYTVENKKIVEKKIINTNGQGHGELIGFLMNNNVDVLICGGIGPGAINYLSETGINVFPGNCGNTDDLVIEFIKGGLAKRDAVCCSHEEGEGCGEHHCH